MKTVRFIALITTFLLAFSLVSCGELNFHYGSAGGEGNGEQSDAGGNEENNENEEETATQFYVYSITERKLHLPDCYHTNRIREDFKQVCYDLDAMLENGYELCQDCFPSEDTEEEENDNTNSVPKDEATFVINASSLKFHKVGCHQTKGMTAKNTVYTTLSYDELVAQEYLPCGSCLKQEETDEDGDENSDAEEGADSTEDAGIGDTNE